EVLLKLLPHLSEEEREAMAQEVLVAARTIEGGKKWAEVLLKLMLYLSEPLHYVTDEQMLAVARAGRGLESRQDVLLRLVEAGYPRPVIIAARVIEDGGERAEVLLALLPYLSEEEREAVVQEALVAARMIEDAGQRAGALGYL